MRRIVHNKALNSRLSHLIITYNMTELPHAHMRGSKHIVVFLFFLIFFDILLSRSIYSVANWSHTTLMRELDSAFSEFLHLLSQ